MEYPKCIKKIPKLRYIAASNQCTTKQLSTIITKCLKLIQNQHRKYCEQIYRRTGVNRMWIVDNSNDILKKEITIIIMTMNVYKM